jgi:hypothetical protein
MSTVSGAGYFGGVVTDGMVLCLDAAKKESYSRSGTQWNDVSDNAHTATINGNPTFTTFDYGEFNLDGTGDYFTIPQGYGDFSNSVCCYEIWCYPEAFPASGEILFMDRATFDAPFGVQIFTLGGGGGAIAVRGNGATFVTSTLLLNAGAWNHVVVNYSGSSTECYINGVYEDLGTITEISTSNYNLHIGTYPTIANTYDFTGKISVARVYNKNLSSNEAERNYNALRVRYGL